MENRNPNIPPFGGRNPFPPATYHHHQQQQQQQPQLPQYPPNKQPTQQQFDYLLRDPFTPFGTPPSWHQQSVPSFSRQQSYPPVSLPPSSFPPSYILPFPPQSSNRPPEKFGRQPSNVLPNLQQQYRLPLLSRSTAPAPTPQRSTPPIDWPALIQIIRKSWAWNDKSRHAPYYDFVKENNTKNEKGWLRKAMNISKERTSNMSTLDYHNLLVQSAAVRTTYQEASRMFYHAFDMDRDAVKYLNKKLKKKKNQKHPPLDPLQQDEIPSSISKRRRTSSSQPPPPPPTNGRSSYLFEYNSNTPSKTTHQTPTKRTPQQIAKVMEQLCNNLPKEAFPHSAKKRVSCGHIKEGLKGMYSHFDGKRFDVQAILRLMLPTTMKFVQKQRMDKLEKNNDLLVQLQSSFKKRYTGNRQAQNYFAAGIAMTPNCSVNSAETFIAFARQSLFAQFGFEASAVDTARSSPSSTTVSNSLANLAASCLNQRLKQMKDAKHVFLTCDKGHRAGVDHFAKVISWYDRKKTQTEYFTLDMDSAGNSDIEAARAIKHSMVQKEVEQKLSGQTTDNGGGATLESFAKELKAEEVTNSDYYSVANCTLHDLSLYI